jgi:hypothetical protein
MRIFINLINKIEQTSHLLAIPCPSQGLQGVSAAWPIDGATRVHHGWSGSDHATVLNEHRWISQPIRHSKIISLMNTYMQKCSLTSMRQSTCSFRSCSLSLKVSLTCAAFTSTCDSFNVCQWYDLEVSQRSSQEIEQTGHGQRLMSPQVSAMTHLAW